MSLLADLEKKLESLVEGFFNKQFRSGLHPLEMAKALEKEIENAKVTSLSGTFSPTSFSIELSASDMERIAPLRETLLLELKELVADIAKREGYRLTSGVEIELEVNEALSLGEMRLESLPPTLPTKEEPAEPGPLKASIVIRGAHRGGDRTILIDRKTTTIGRLPGCDIRLDDQSASRLHAEIRRSEAKYLIKDLGSTNGTLLNGVPIELAPLRDGDIIAIGKTRLELKLSDF